MSLTFKQKVAGVIVAVLALFGIGQSVNLGSVQYGSEYHATTTASTWANTPKRVTAAGGTLGSVIIGTTDASIVELMDATSSTDIASTTIGVIAASPVNGSNFVFDTVILRGLMVNTKTGFAGRYTVTYR